MEDPRREVTEDEPRFIVRVQGVDAENRPAHGTGFFITERGHVATCLHVVQNLREIEVKHPFERPWKYRIVSSDPEHDLAILVGDVRPTFTPPFVTLARGKVFDTSETLRFYGWSDAERFSAPRARLCTFSASSERYGLIGLNAFADPGDSGGPVLDERNEVVALIRVRDKHRTGNTLAIPSELLRELAEDLLPVSNEARSVAPPAVRNRLLGLNRAEFERLLLLASVPQQKLPAYSEGQDARAHAAAELLDLDTIESIAKTLAANATLGAKIGNGFWTFIARISKRFYDAFARQWIREPVERRALDDYHAELATRMKAENAVHLIEQNVGVIEEPADSDPFAMKVRRGITVERVRHLLRLLSGLSHGGEQESAELASLQRRSRLVRNAVATLLGADQPLILLGEPGSGKSMTLREVARDLVRWKNIGPRPPVIVYARLGTYRSMQGDAPGDIVDFIRQQIPPQYESIRNAVPTFIAEKRLIVLFDGMDEMERRRYNERVRLLSSFASQHEGSVKTLFSCRINDFTSEFAHHQLVLLPFGDSQIAEFVKKNVRLPRTIDGTVYTRHAQLIRDLRARPGLPDVVNNPLMLFLTCEYIVTRESWPETRASLFRNFIEQHLEDLREAERITLSEGDADAFFAGWAAIGFDLIRRGLGDADVGAIEPRLIEIGMRAGLLQLDPDDGNRVRFTHHRFKEYFAALHIATLAPGSVPWKNVLDEAGWQETLLNLASIDPANAAIAELQRSIEVLLAALRPGGAEDDEDNLFAFEHLRQIQMGRAGIWLLHAEAERMLADRLVLASHIVRETKAERAVLPAGFEDAFYDALRFLAKRGRPTSQVKMLWAWKNAPGTSVAEALDAPINSTISWVRDQAILVVAAVGGSDLSRNLGIELAVDLAAERVLDRLPTYRRAARGSRRWMFATMVAALCHLALLAASSGIVLIGVAIATFASRKYLPAFLTPTIAQATLVLLTLLLVPMLWRKAAMGTARRMIYATAIAGLGWGLVWLAVRKGISSALLPAFVFLVGFSWFPGVLAELVFWPIALLFAGILNIVGSGSTRSTALRIFRSSPAVRATWTLTRPMLLYPLACVAGASLMGGVIWMLKNIRKLIEGSGWGAVLVIAKWSLLVVPGALLLVGLILLAFPRSRDTAAPKVFKILLNVAGIAFWPALFIWVLPLLGRILSWLGKVFGAGGVLWLSLLVLGIGLIVLVLFLCVHYYGIVKGLLTRARRIPVDQWREQVMTGNPILQHSYLRVDRSQFAPRALTAAEYLELLTDVEPFVKEEPAADEYWRRRHQIEQAVRQDRP